MQVLEGGDVTDRPPLLDPPLARGRNKYT